MSSSILGAALQAAQVVNGERLWSRLARMAEVGATARGGVNRPALSPEDGQSRSLLLSWAAELNTQTSMDNIGNLFIRRPGRSPGRAGIMLGSHLDSQPTGGRYDGTYGVLSALEVLCALDEAGIETELPVDVSVWSNEEGSRFSPGCMGSAVFAGAASLAKMLFAIRPLARRLHSRKHGHCDGEAPLIAPKLARTIRSLRYGRKGISFKLPSAMSALGVRRDKAARSSG